jgi:hypothetical protein
MIIKLLTIGRAGRNIENIFPDWLPKKAFGCFREMKWN